MYIRHEWKLISLFIHVYIYKEEGEHIHVDEGGTKLGIMKEIASLN